MQEKKNGDVQRSRVRELPVVLLELMFLDVGRRLGHDVKLETGVFKVFVLKSGTEPDKGTTLEWGGRNARVEGRFYTVVSF